MNEQLKPCPFCEGRVYMMNFMGMSEFKCPKCGVLVSFVGREKTKDAVDAWNKRGSEEKL